MMQLREIYSPQLFDKNGDYIDISDLPDQKNVDLSVIITVEDNLETGSVDFYTRVITGEPPEDYKRRVGELPYDGKLLFFDCFKASEVVERIKSIIKICDVGTWEDGVKNLGDYFLCEYD